MPPLWLTALSWATLSAAFVSAPWIVFDLYGHGYRQHMRIMAADWPVTALYFGPAAVAAYRAWGRLMSARWPRDSSVYWFLMQIGMIAGFFTAWPVNGWLIRAGVKEAM